MHHDDGTDHAGRGIGSYPAAAAIMASKSTIITLDQLLLMPTTDDPAGGAGPGTHLARTLRHKHATELVNDGVGLATIRKRLGHKNLQATLRYAEQTDATADAEHAAGAATRRPAALCCLVPCRSPQSGRGIGAIGAPAEVPGRSKPVG